MTEGRLLPEQLADAVGSGLVVVDEFGTIRLWNRWMRELCRVRVEPLGAGLREACDGEIEQRVHLAVREALDLGMPARLSHVLHPTPFPLYSSRHATSRLRQSVSVSPIQGPEGVRWCLIQVTDVTSAATREQLLKEQKRQRSEEVAKLKQAQELLRKNELRFRELAQQAPVGIFEIDTRGVVVFANERWQHLVGEEYQSGTTERWFAVASVEDRAQVSQAFQAALSSGQRFHVEFRCTNRDTLRKFWVNVDAMPIRDEVSALSGYVCTAVDVNDAKEAALRAAHQATYDELTGLYNRSPFLERLKLASSQAAPFAVMFLDLDGFKAVNDEHGHAAGDLVLKAVARRLRRVLRADDTVARFGGDEFVALLAGASTDGALHRVRYKLKRAIEQPINVGTCHVELGGSIGVARFPDDGRDPAALLRQADEAMYEAKRRRQSQPSSSSMEAASAMPSPESLPAPRGSDVPEALPLAQVVVRLG
jgi:diguanylate cyclase (GGDEF)-like protein/PAS domain S-box-containing protein